MNCDLGRVVFVYVVVSLLAVYYKNPSSNPDGIDSFCYLKIIGKECK